MYVRIRNQKSFYVHQVKKENQQQCFIKTKQFKQKMHCNKLVSFIGFLKYSQPKFSILALRMDKPLTTKTIVHSLTLK